MKIGSPSFVMSWVALLSGIGCGDARVETEADLNQANVAPQAVVSNPSVVQSRSCSLSFKSKLAVYNRILWKGGTNVTRTVEDAQVRLEVLPSNTSTWQVADTTKTGSGGSFKLTHQYTSLVTCAPVQARLRVRFEDDDIKLIGGQETFDVSPWYTFWDSSTETSTGWPSGDWLWGGANWMADSGVSSQLQALAFCDPTDSACTSLRDRKSGAYQFGDGGYTWWEMVSHASIWTALKDLTAKFKSMEQATGLPFSMPKTAPKLRVKYPVHGVANSSYTDPALRNVMLFKEVPLDPNDTTNDQLFAEALFHEVMHLWAYAHMKGELGLAVDALTPPTGTHFWSSSRAAFHEALADFASSQLVTAMYPTLNGLESNAFGELCSTEARTPFNRKHVADILKEKLPWTPPASTLPAGQPAVPQTQISKLMWNELKNRHEFFWSNLFRVLTTANIGDHTFGTRSSAPSEDDYSVANATADICTGEWSLSLEDFLSPLLQSSTLDMLDASSITYAVVLDRFESSKKITATQRANIETLVSPLETSEPVSLVSCHL